MNGWKQPLLPIALAVLVTLMGFARLQAQTGHTAHAEPGELAAGTASPHSIYHVDSTWTTESGQRIRLDALRGKIRVLAMVYTSCEYACPLLVEIMKRMATSLPQELQSQVGFVLVSFDPERDTPEVLKAYSEKQQLDVQRWTLLHGQPDDVRELAVLLGVKYIKQPRGDFAHSNLITVLNREGEIVHRHLGLQQSIDDTVAVLRQMAEGA